MTDERFDYILKEAVKEAVILETGEIKRKSRGFFYKPSKEFEEKMERLLSRKEKNDAETGAGTDDFEGDIRNVKWEMQEKTGGTLEKANGKAIHGNRRTHMKGKGKLFNKIKWIPEGYKKTDSHTDGTDSYFYTETFENENGDLILYGQYPENYEMNLSYDKSSGIQSTIDICGIEGTYISDEEGKTITYGADDVMYMIRGNVSKNKLVKMLESRVRAEE